LHLFRDEALQREVELKMAKNIGLELNALYRQFTAGQLDRRDLIKAAGGLGMSATGLAMFAKAVPASAQGATPEASPVASPVEGGATPEATYPPFKSMNREEFKAALMAWWKDYEKPAKQGGTFIYGDLGSNNLTGFNLVVASSDPTLSFDQAVQEFLVGTSPIDGAFSPGLADYYEIATDGKTYTFHLNQSAKWHDGQPFTADDVIFSFDATKDPATSSAYTSSFNSVVASFSKVDNHTVTVVANGIIAPIVFLGLALSGIVPQHIWKDVPHANWLSDAGNTGTDPSRVVGTGPFKFGSTSASEGTTTFVKNPDYYDTPAVLDKLIFQTWPDDTALVEALRTGAIDLYQPVNPADVPSLQGKSNTDVLLYDGFGFGWYGYQLDPARSKLFLDVRTRQALFEGLDRESIVKNIYLGFASVADGTQPTISIAYDPASIKTHYSYDVAKSKQLLADVGWKDSNGDGILELNGEKFSFKITYGAGGTNDQLAAYLQQAWKAIGVEATPDPVDFNKVLVPVITQTFDFQMVLLAFNWDITGDQSAMFKTGGGFNPMKYSNPTVDKLMEESNVELDPQKRIALLKQINNIVNDELPIGCLLFRKGRDGYAKRVHNYYANGYAGWLGPLTYMWVD